MRSIPVLPRPPGPPCPPSPRTCPLVPSPFAIVLLPLKPSSRLRSDLSSVSPAWMPLLQLAALLSIARAAASSSRSSLGPRSQTVCLVHVGGDGYEVLEGGDGGPGGRCSTSGAGGAVRAVWRLRGSGQRGFRPSPFPIHNRGRQGNTRYSVPISS